MELDTPLGNPHSLLDSSKSVAGTSKGDACEGAILEKTCHKDELKSRMDVIDLSREAEMPMEGIKDLNVEPDKWVFIQNEPMLPGQSSSGNHTLSSGTGYTSPRKDNMHNETVNPLEKVSTDRRTLTRLYTWQFYIYHRLVTRMVLWHR